LDDIEGIGAARRKSLMKHFESAEAMAEATVEELAEIPSMDKRAAQAVYDYLH
jgi:excinuclease ABC subunit C